MSKNDFLNSILASLPSNLHYNSKSKDPNNDAFKASDLSKENTYYIYFNPDGSISRISEKTLDSLGYNYLYNNNPTSFSARKNLFSLDESDKNEPIGYTEVRLMLDHLSNGTYTEDFSKKNKDNSVYTHKKTYTQSASGQTIHDKVNNGRILIINDSSFIDNSINQTTSIIFSRSKAKYTVNQTNGVVQSIDMPSSGEKKSYIYEYGTWFEKKDGYCEMVSSSTLSTINETISSLMSHDYLKTFTQDDFTNYREKSDEVRNVMKNPPIKAIDDSIQPEPGPDR